MSSSGRNRKICIALHCLVTRLTDHSSKDELFYATEYSRALLEEIEKSILLHRFVMRLADHSSEDALFYMPLNIVKICFQ